MKSNKKNSNRNKRTTTSKLYSRLSNNENIFQVRTTPGSTQAGVRVATRGVHKGSTVEILLPSTTVDGRDRTVMVGLTGRQARAIYETLARHYDNKA